MNLTFKGLRVQAKLLTLLSLYIVNTHTVHIFLMYCYTEGSIFKVLSPSHTF